MPVAKDYKKETAYFCMFTEAIRKFKVIHVSHNAFVFSSGGLG